MASSKEKSEDLDTDHLESVYDLLARFNLLHHLKETGHSATADDNLSDDDGLISVKDLLNQHNDHDRSRTLSGSENISEMCQEQASHRNLSSQNTRYDV